MRFGIQRPHRHGNPSLRRAAGAALDSLERRTLLADIATGLALTLPADAWEGQANRSGVVHIDEPAAEPLAVTLMSSDTSELIAPATVTIAAGETSASFPLTLPADGLKDGVQAASLTASDIDGTITALASVAVHDAELDRFAIDPIAGPQSAGQPFGVTARAVNVSNEPIVGYNGSASLGGVVGTISSQTAFAGSTTVTSTSSSGGTTWGYSFRPNQVVTVTHLRSFFGAKVSIWSGNNPALLATQTVAGTPGQWTETPLDRPLVLQPTLSYRIGVFAASGTYSFRNTTPTFPWGQIFAGLYVSADGPPTSGGTSNIPLVDLRVSTGAVIPVTPTSATFADGVWSGDVTVAQHASGMRLVLDDRAGHTADSTTFDVTTTAPTSVTLDSFSDTGVITSDAVTRLDNSSEVKAMDFVVTGTVAGATISLYADGTLIGSKVASSATTSVRSEGTFDLTDGVHSITARQTPAAGVQSIDSPALSLTIDTVAPAAPNAPDLIAASDSGASSFDNLTNVKTPTFTITGTTWFRLTRNGALMNGAYFSGSYAIPTTSDGTYAFAALAADIAGNETAGPSLNVTIDTVAQTPALPDLRAGDDTGPSDADNLTRLRDARIDVPAGEAGTMHLFVDGVDRSISLGAAGTATTTLSGPPGWVSPFVATAGNPLLRVDHGDFNRDGKLDLLSIGAGGTVHVNLGNGNGTFQQSPIDAPSSGSNASVAAGDFNRDGKLDAVYAARSNAVYVLWGNGDGTFTTGPTLSLGSSGYNEDVVTTGDMNGDGTSDIVVSLLNYSCVVTILSNGTGTFGIARQYYAGGFAYAPTVADMNNDGRQDVVVSAMGPSGPYVSSVLLGNGDGTLRSVITSGAQLGYPDGYAVGDFDRDGKADVMAVDGVGTGRLYKGVGSGHLSAGSTVSVGAAVAAGAAGDADGDGNLDFVAATWSGTSNGSTIRILLGNGDGTFRTPLSLGVLTTPKDVTTADFDSDGRADFATATYSSDGIAVLQYRSGAGTDGPHSIYATFEDRAGNKSGTSPTLTVQVDTKAPVITLPVASNANATVPFTAGGLFSDVGDPGNTWTATVDFGDGVGVRPLALNADKTFALANTYTTPGTYTALVAITDNQGNVAARNVVVTVGPGPQGIESAAGASYTLSGNSLIVHNGTVTLTQDLAGIDLVVNAGATVLLRANQHWHSLSVAAGGKASVEAGVAMLVVDQLQLAPGATLDLRRAALVTKQSLAAIEGLIASGADGGTWQGDGIVTSDPDAALGLTSLGAASSDQVLGLAANQTEVWRGETVAAGATLILYTYGGDANLDGFISGDDYAAIDFNIAVPGSGAWCNGDFNYDGIISGDDYAAIDFNIVAQGTPL